LRSISDRFIFQQIIGVQNGPGTYFNVVGVTPKVFGTRTINYLAILFLPLAAIAFDLSGKVFSNMFYPTQTQIHIEIEAKQRREKRKAARRGDDLPGPTTNVRSHEMSA